MSVIHVTGRFKCVLAPTLSRKNYIVGKIYEGERHYDRTWKDYYWFIEGEHGPEAWTEKAGSIDTYFEKVEDEVPAPPTEYWEKGDPSLVYIKPEHEDKWAHEDADWMAKFAAASREPKTSRLIFTPKQGPDVLGQPEPEPPFEVDTNVLAFICILLCIGILIYLFIHV